MSPKRYLFFTLIGFVIATSTNAMALSATTAPALDPPATPVELGADVNNLVFSGTIKKISDGTALVTEKATYLLAGGNFEEIVGRQVNIIGKLRKNGSAATIDVARAQLAQR